MTTPTTTGRPDTLCVSGAHCFVNDSRVCHCGLTIRTEASPRTLGAKEEMLRKLRDVLSWLEAQP